MNIPHIGFRVSGEILIGYQLNNGTQDSVVNPKDKLVPKTWDQYDMIILVPPNEFHIKTAKVYLFDRSLYRINFIFKSVGKEECKECYRCSISQEP